MRVAEVAELLKVSKKTVYRKIQKLDLTSKGHVEQLGQTKNIDSEGVELIRLSLVNGRVKDMSNANVTIESVTRIEDHAIESYKLLLEEQKELYEKLIQEKDRLIDDLKRDKDRLMQMQENNQVLLKLEQEKNLLLQEPKMKKSFLDRFKKSQPNPNWDNNSE